MMSKTFVQRMCIGFTITLVTFLLIYLSQFPLLVLPFIAFLGTALIFCLYEYFNILKSLQIIPEKTLLVIISMLYFISVIFLSNEHLPIAFLILTLISTFLSVIIKKKISISSVAFTLFGLAWITIPLVSTYQINFYFAPDALEKGQFWLLYVLFVTKMCDTIAYFVGSRLGRTSLSPAISPKKTVEGAIGGIVGAIATSYLFYHFSLITITFYGSIFLGLIMAVLTGLGDLSESIFKRDAGVKDSNHIPGLGGVLDIADSILFTAPCVYFYLLWNFPK